MDEGEWDGETVLGSSESRCTGWQMDVDVCTVQYLHVETMAKCEWTRAASRIFLWVVGCGLWAVGASDPVVAFLQSVDGRGTRCRTEFALQGDLFLESGPCLATGSAKVEDLCPLQVGYSPAKQVYLQWVGGICHVDVSRYHCIAPFDFFTTHT